MSRKVRYEEEFDVTGLKGCSLKDLEEKREKMYKMDVTRVGERITGESVDSLPLVVPDNAAKEQGQTLLNNKILSALHVAEGTQSKLKKIDVEF